MIINGLATVRLRIYGYSNPYSRILKLWSGVFLGVLGVYAALFGIWASTIVAPLWLDTALSNLLNVLANPRHLSHHEI